MFLKRKGSEFYPPPRIVCFVCAAEGPADYPLYIEPQHKTFSSPHFPFLLAHPPPAGCSSVVSKVGEAKACRPCYTSLMRQWDEFEQARVPTIKRVYWIKRVDGVDFLNSDEQTRAAIQVQARIGGVTVVATTNDGVMIAPLPPSGITNDTLAVTKVPNAPAAHLSWNSAKPDSKLTSARNNVIAMPPEETLYSSNVSGDNDSALDLSSGSRERDTMKSRSSATSHISAVSLHSSYQSEGASTDISDLTLPDHNAAYEVCYVCGDEYKKGSLSITFVKQIVNREPYYPSLLNHSRPPRSRPIDSSGRVQTCDDCHNHLLEQWYQYESDEVPQDNRNYTLRKRQVVSSDNSTFVCYICSLDYQTSSLRLLYARPNSEEEPYYRFLEQHKPPPRANPISSQGTVQVCQLCFKSTKERHHGFLKADQPPPKKRRIENTPDFSQCQDDEDKNNIPADIMCILCRRKYSIGSFKLIHTQSSSSNTPFFPFLAEIAKSEELIDEAEKGKNGKVRVCVACTNNLVNQWMAHAKKGIAVEDREYSYPIMITADRSISSLRAQSPASRSQKSGGTVTPGASSVKKHNDENQNVSRSRSNTLESRQHSTSTPHSPNPQQNPIPTTTPSVNQNAKAISSLAGTSTVPPSCHSPSFSVHSTTSAATTEGPQGGNSNANFSVPPNGQSKASTSSFYCFLCGLHSELSFSRILYSNQQGTRAPYFPFLKAHVPKNKAETLRENGTALVCTFCYHSVMAQWLKYENISSSRTEASKRKYNFNEYNCFVCYITTYRKRVRALRVVDFPFLREHKHGKDVILLENGEMVAVCLDCYERLREQFEEGEKYGVPVNKRQYNWLQIPPPPEDSSAQITTPQERLGKSDPPISSS